MKLKDHGFSLVELVVVVAIMAVLVGIVAPVYLRYIEKTRIQRDESAAGEIYRAAEIAVYTGEYEIPEQVLLTFNSSGISINTELLNQNAIESVLAEHFGEQYQTTVPVSKKYKNSTYTITILPPEEGSLVPRLSGAWD
jgi:type IV pilus assembly protein PilA